MPDDMADHPRSQRHEPNNNYAAARLILCATTEEQMRRQGDTRAKPSYPSYVPNIGKLFYHLKPVHNGVEVIDRKTWERGDGLSQEVRPVADH